MHAFFHGGDELAGTTPPTMASSNSNPVPRGSGWSSTVQSPYWPWPPVWRLNLPWALDGAVMVSR